MPLENLRPVSTTRFSPCGLMYQTLLGLPSQPGGDVDAAVVADDQVVAAEALGDHGGLAVGVVGEDLLAAWPPRTAGRRDRTPGRSPFSSRRGTGSPCRRGRSCRSCCSGMSLKKTSPCAIGGRPLGEPVAVGDELPVLAGDEDLLQLRRARPRP